MGGHLRSADLLGREFVYGHESSEGAAIGGPRELRAGGLARAHVVAQVPPPGAKAKVGSQVQITVGDGRLLKNPFSAQAAQKGPDARRRAKGRVRRTPGTPQRAPERANAADGPFSAACKEAS